MECYFVWNRAQWTIMYNQAMDVETELPKSSVVYPDLIPFPSCAYANLEIHQQKFQKKRSLCNILPNSKKNIPISLEKVCLFPKIK